MRNSVNSIGNNVRYFMLEKGVCYDWDDYGVWADIVFDQQENKIIVENYGHGTNSRFDDIATNDFSELNKENCIKAIFDYLNIDMSKLYAYVDCERLKQVPCKVTKGRKLKGDLVLIKYVDVTRSTYYKNYTDTFAVVADMKTKSYCKVKPEYIDIDKSFINSDLILQICLEKGIKSIAHLIAYRISYSYCDSKNLSDYLSDIALDCFCSKLIINVDFNTFTDLDKVNHENKMKPINDKLRNEHMPKLIDWAKSKLPNGTKEEIEELAEKVFSKYYKKK